jgi:AraC-like DNA-binding protein
MISVLVKRGSCRREVLHAISTERIQNGFWRIPPAIPRSGANIGRSIRLAELAEVCGLSKTHFGRAFKAASGKTPHGYLIWLRVEQAKHLLETTSMSMLEIADKCGFGQPQYFATVFQREVGITPTAWRLEKGS